MIKAAPLNDALKESFCALFKDYYNELNCEDDAEHLVNEYVLPDLMRGLLSVDILEDGGKNVGFVIYQIDSEKNDWNNRSGWGDIREIYVAAPSRGQGLGKFLLFTAEMKLKEAGAERAYCMPNEQAEQFFASCGYCKTNEFCEELESFIYEKTNLNNCCNK